MMALGGLLGYAAASGHFASLRQARAAAPTSEPGLAGNPGPSCSYEGGGTDALLAKAGGPEARQEKVAPARDRKQPNVVFILADNVGYGDLGCYGGGELRGAPTPRLDRMAREVCD
jgi:hypothetical protein